MERVPQLPLLMKKKPARIKKELNVVKKTKRDDDEFNKEKVITKKAKKEKDVVITKEEEDETTQYCSYCGASRVQPGAVRCEACGIYN